VEQLDNYTQHVSRELFYLANNKYKNHVKQVLAENVFIVKTSVKCHMREHAELKSLSSQSLVAYSTVQASNNTNNNLVTMND